MTLELAVLKLHPYPTLPYPTKRINMAVKKTKKHRTFNERINFWVGPSHKKLFDRAGETLGINRSVLVRRMCYFLDKPREELIELFGKDVDGYKYPPKKAV